MNDRYEWLYCTHCCLFISVMSGRGGKSSFVLGNAQIVFIGPVGIAFCWLIEWSSYLRNLDFLRRLLPNSKDWIWILYLTLTLQYVWYECEKFWTPKRQYSVKRTVGYGSMHHLWVSLMLTIRNSVLQTRLNGFVSMLIA